MTIFLPWLAHTVCFVALLCRHPSSRLAGAGLWAGWGVLLVWQVMRELVRYGPRRPGELVLALALIAAALAMAALVGRSRYPA